MRKQRSWFQAVLALLATEHRCAAPDGASTWDLVSKYCARALPPGDVYVCPECGQHMARALAPADTINSQSAA
jgi:hypothetical protein